MISPSRSSTPATCMRRLPRPMTQVPCNGPNPGDLEMFVHLPRGLKPGAPLVVVLHGCTQSAADHARDAGWLALADEAGFAVLAPGQKRSNNANLCFNWYEAMDASGPSGEAASIVEMIRHIVAEYRLDMDRVFVTGLSAGGAMAFAMVYSHPQLFAGAGIIAGLPAGSAGSLQEALGLMSGRRRATIHRTTDRAHGCATPRVSIWQGSADTLVTPVNAQDIARQWAAKHGLSAGPDRVERLASRERSVWLDPKSGLVSMELQVLTGFGHATPLSSLGSEGLGHPAPHMVECGISSTLEIARFWQLVEERSAIGDGTEDHPTSHGDATGPSPVADVVMNSLGGVSQPIRDLVRRSLASAGL